MDALILAGGRGERLRPLTDDCPKPLLLVGGRPLLDHTIERLRRDAFEHIGIAVHYQAPKIENHYAEGRGFGVQIEYIHEDKPLGTGGALALAGPPDEPMLVMNGDLWTDLDFCALEAFHHHHGAALTAASWDYETHNRYGLLLTDGLNVTGLREKAGIRSPVLAGIYMLSPICWSFLPKGAFDMTDLVARLITLGLPVKHFPMRGYTWEDIGTLEDYERVCAMVSREEVAV